MNLWDILILLVIGAAVVFSLRSRRRAEKNGTGCCSGGCGGCAACVKGAQDK